MKSRKVCALCEVKVCLCLVIVVGYVRALEKMLFNVTIIYYMFNLSPLCSNTLSVAKLAIWCYRAFICTAVK